MARTKGREVHMEILVRKREGKRPFGRPTCRLDDDDDENNNNNNNNNNNKVKQSRYRPGVAQRVPGS